MRFTTLFLATLSVLASTVSARKLVGGYRGTWHNPAVLGGQDNSTSNGTTVLAPQLNANAQSNTTMYLWALNAKHGASFLECWALLPDLTMAMSPGLLFSYQQFLGNATSVGYNRFPDDYDTPLHGPIKNEYVTFLTGSATVSFPTNNQTKTFYAGYIIAAVDNCNVSAGHYTNYTAGTSVMSIQFPRGVPPPHKVVDLSFCPQ